MRDRVWIVLTSLLFLAATPHPARRVMRVNDRDWLQFGAAAVDGETPRTSISPANVRQLGIAWRSALPEACDGSPIYVSSALTKNGVRDLLIVETTTGRLVALDANNGVVIWQTTPPPGPRWTTSSPAVDPSRKYVFAYTLDGYVHRYEVRTGREVAGPGWPALITTKGDVEKGSSNISIATARDGQTYLYMPIAAYPDPGDDGDYQGHLVTVNIATGEQHVFNALCSDRAVHFLATGDERDCANVQAGIWARAGAIYDPQTDRVFVTTGNGPFSADRGGFDWGSSVVALRPDGTVDSGTPLDSYTPEDYQRLTDEDLDLSSTTIEPLPVAETRTWPRLGVQSGKDGRIRLLNLEDLSGQGGPRHIGGELQIVDLPQGGMVLTQPTAWLDPATGKTWLFVANREGITGFELIERIDGAPELVQRWSRKTGGTTPIVLNGVLYLASPQKLIAMRPRSGTILWRDRSLGDVHWQSPIIVGDTIFVADLANFVTAYSLGYGNSAPSGTR